MAATAYDIIIRPIISEQSMEDIDSKKYVFEVLPGANKIQIKEAVEKIFGVTVEKVNTLNYDGKLKRTGRYPEGRRKAWKKAVVKLTPDSKSIELFEGMI
ncbi:MAG: 50S ribosomal protein L23 [Oscillospiraceae bacterium]|jgi:large subunit ribosomal protein L23|nr:50S ribosomal protein L23 [Oscillospiraceae bacterium]